MRRIVDWLMKILIILTIVLWIISIFKPSLVKDLIEWIRGFVLVLWNWNYLIVFTSSLIEAFPVLGVVVPGQNILLIVWWFFWEISRFNLIYVIIISSVWAIVWNYIWYLLWKIYWEKFFKKYGLWFWIWETEVKYLKKWIKKWGATWIIVWKFHNLARAFVPFIAWSMWMKKTSFMVYNTIWSIIRSVTIITLGVIFAKIYESVIDYIWYIIIWIMILTWIYIWRFKKREFIKYIEEKNKEIESKIG